MRMIAGGFLVLSGTIAWAVAVVLLDVEGVKPRDGWGPLLLGLIGLAELVMGLRLLLRGRRSDAS